MNIILGIFITSLFLLNTYGSIQLSSQLKEKVMSNVGVMIEIKSVLEDSEFDHIIKRPQLTENLKEMASYLDNEKDVSKFSYSVIPTSSYFNVDIELMNQCDDSRCKTPIIKGVRSTDFINLGRFNRINLVEGRSFSSTEIEVGEKVVLLPIDTQGMDSEVLKLGDFISLRIESIDDLTYETADIMDHSFKVIGFYEENRVVNPPKANDKFGNGLNSVYIPSETLENLTLEMKNTSLLSESRFDDSLFFGEVFAELSEPRSSQRIIDELNSISSKPQTEEIDSYFSIFSSKVELERILAPITMFEQLSIIMFSISILFTVVVTFLVIRAFIIQKRSEIALYISLGKSKTFVFLQLLMELGVLTIVGIVLASIVSFGLLSLIASGLSNTVSLSSNNILKYGIQLPYQLFFICIGIMLSIVMVSIILTLTRLYSSKNLVSILSTYRD